MNGDQGAVSADQYLAGLLIVFYRAVRKHLLLFFLLPLTAMLITFFVAKQQTPIYAAEANVRVGRLDGADVISPKAAAARISSPSFKEHVLRSMNLAAPGNARAARLIFDTLTARPDETSDSLNASVHAFSDEQLRQALEVTVRLLNEDQEKIQGALFADVRAQVAAADANIARLEQARESLSALATAATGRATSEAEPSDQATLALRSVLLSELMSRNERALFTAKADRVALAARLSPWKTYPAAIVDDVYVSRNPLSPQSKEMAIIAGAVTLLLVLLYALISGPRAIRPN